MSEGKTQERRGVGLTLIAVGKLIQVLLFCAVGAAAILFAKRVPPDVVKEWADAFAPESDWLQGLVDKLVRASNEKLALVGKASFAYAALFSIEGIGLWRNKRWAEYLTVLVTGSFLPFELRGLFHEFNVAKLVATIVNGAVVVYLTTRLILEHRKHKH